MRLDKLLWNHGLHSKKKIKQAIRHHEVMIDGEPARHIGQNVDASLQHISLFNRPIKDSSQLYFMLHKPKGVVTAVKDSSKQTVLDLLDPEDRPQGIYHIGRLDADTEGLLLLTNNGPLGLRMLHPDHHISKTYLVEVNAAIDWRAISRFDQGITFRDGTRCRSAQLQILESRPGYSLATVTLSEGKFHQVKKMFLAVGSKVTSLKRISFGPFELDASLEPGQYRPLTQDELLLLKPYLD
ncbi:pseudouridine synthase [Streptococcus moroccensis]|uniref:Pseudouridine synthase n=1 Tax=Streptococcus moroccensis TaxID=1451356 RepID=A0ABT9YPX2_9STRE|nr:pseudouridine synthase [Streptococcus moroccensis]MDQ0221820.1 16S rRNA pseudouridine516 synthase [Streptococcus moroccensis]